MPGSILNVCGVVALTYLIITPTIIDNIVDYFFWAPLEFVIPFLSEVE